MTKRKKFALAAAGLLLGVLIGLLAAGEPAAALLVLGVLFVGVGR